MLLPVTAADIPDFAAACAHEHIFGSRALTALRHTVYADFDKLFASAFRRKGFGKWPGPAKPMC